MHNTHISAQEHEQPKRQKPSFGRELFSWIGSLATAIIAALLIITFVFQIILVDGPSMMNTLQDGERMFVTKINYRFHDPERFDVVVCHFPERGRENFVKRIVGVPGDTIAVRNGQLYVNGEMVQEDYIDYPPQYTMEEVTVAEGHYFVLGDNRAVSNDSHIVGQLTRDQIVGEVQAVIWPLSAIRTIQ